MEGFEAFYERYCVQVYRFLLALTGDSRQAEELTQETFYRAFLHMESFGGRCSLFTWLCEIGKNCWLTQLRKEKRKEPLEAAAEWPDPAPRLEEQVGERELRQALRREIMELPGELRDVVILHVYGEIPLKEIAARYGKSESWGRVTYHRARRQLQKRLEEYR